MMRFGIIGRGLWGAVWKAQLETIGHAVIWQRGHDWRAERQRPDGVIIASAPESHYWLARELIRDGMPIIIEKPMCLKASHARHLLAIANKNRAIVYVDHTRLYSPAWREFKAKIQRVDSVFMQAGGPSKIGWLWDWGPHLVAMSLDLGYDPLKAHLVEMPDRIPITVTVNGKERFTDAPTTPSALEVLTTEFCAAIENGKPEIRDLELGVRVTEALEAMQEAEIGA